MTVDELRELLAGVPGHLPVRVQILIEDENSGGVDVDSVEVLTAEVSGAMHLGRFFSIIGAED